MTSLRSLRFQGPFDARAGAEAEQIAAFLARRTPAVPPGSVLIDLGAVTQLDRAAVQSLNRAWRVLTDCGWCVDVTTPERPGARAAFVTAAIRGDLEWARGSGSGASPLRERNFRAR